VTDAPPTPPAFGPSDRPVLGAVRLLEIWAATRKLHLVPGTAPRAEQEPWTTPPSPAQVDGYAGFAGPRTVRVEPIRVEGRSSPGADPAGTAARLIREALTPDGAALDRRAGLLADLLGSVLTDWFSDLIRIDTAGPPGELHLLRRRWGSTLHLSVLPGEAEGGFARRVEGIGAALGILLPLTNNSHAGFTASVVPHGLDLDPADLDPADTAVRAWWPTSDTGRDFEEWHEDLQEEDEGVPTPQRLDTEAWTAVRADLEAQSVQGAAVNAWAVDDPGADTLGELAGYLIRDLLEQVTTEVTGAPDRPPLLVYGIGLDQVLPGEGDPGAFGCILLVGPHRAGTVELNFSY
jgi:hypothetical protein